MYDNTVTTKHDAKKENLKISHEVLVTIAQQVVGDIAGVHALSSCPLRVKEMLYKNTMPKSIRIDMSEDVAMIDISVVLNFGYNAKEVVEKIQVAVKDAVQHMTGITVSKVNVYVTDVHFEQAVQRTL